MTMQPAADPRFDFDQADRLRRALRFNELGVGEMAEYLQVSPNTVSNWINGRAKPRPRDLKLFALKTGFPVGWLETGDWDGPDGGNSQEETSEITFRLLPSRRDRPVVALPYAREAVAA